jgi:N,N'-diacetylbacillosaminyl-diphospho-undecaprenol alpha-1,3-N-acetylgalactosaminyltransferase
MAMPTQLRVAILIPADFAVWTFHRGLIAALQQHNANVTIIGPAGEYVTAIERLGVRYLTVQLERFMNPVHDMNLMQTLYTIFRGENFDVVHNHTVKPNIYGTLAARMAGVHTILGSVRGRGSLFTEVNGIKRRMLRRTAMLMYRFAFNFINRVQFLNRDDLEFFVHSHMLCSNKAVLIRSSGVNLQEFSTSSVQPETLVRLRATLNLAPHTPVVLMIARAYWSKGVREFIEAAHLVGPRHNAVFLLVGSVESGPDTVPRTYLEAHQSDHFRWLNYRKDVRELLALSDIAVLPSYYPEGVPRSMLEAMAMERPVVTTDSIGCREVVDHGANGFMVPVRDVRHLAAAIDLLLQNASLRQVMGHRSRIKAMREFDEADVNKRVLRELYLM